MAGLQPLEGGLAYLRPIGAEQEMQARDQEMRIKGAEAPVRLQQLQALARLHSAQAADKEAETAADVQMGNVMRNWRPVPGRKMSEELANLAPLAAQGGSPLAAMKMLAASTQAADREAHADAQAAMADVRRQRESLLEQQLFDRTLARIQTPEEFDGLLKEYVSAGGSPQTAQVYKEQFEQGGPLAIDQFRRRAMSEYQRQQLEIRRQAQVQSSYRQAQELILRQRQVAASEARVQIAREAQQAKTKVGGKDVGQPTQQQIFNAMTFLSNTPKWDVLAEEARPQAALEIASRINGKLKRNEAPDARAAFAQAYLEMEREGRFEDTTTWYGKAVTKMKPSTEAPPATGPTKAPTVTIDEARVLYERATKGTQKDPEMAAELEKLFPELKSARPSVPKVGDVYKGYRFRGGDPSQQSSWEKVQ